MDCFFLKTVPCADTVEVYVSEFEVEMDMFKKLAPGSADYALGEVAGKFEPTVFFANPAMELKFPRYCAVARSYFAGRTSEDTSERTFSFAGRHLSDLRGRLDPAQACASVMCVAGSKHYAVTSEEVWGQYASRRRFFECSWQQQVQLRPFAICPWLTLHSAL
jgi:hypothetical protein